jgi:hypothetical protein
VYVMGVCGVVWCDVCSADIKEMSAEKRPRDLLTAWRAISEVKLPVIAAVNGTTQPYAACVSVVFNVFT